MTEAEWMACTDLEKLLEFLRGKATGRKLRLFAVACCRRAGDLFKKDRHLPDLLAFTEGFADGEGAEIADSTSAVPSGEEDSVAVYVSHDVIAALAPTIPYGEPNPHFLLRNSLIHEDAGVAAWNTVSNIVYQYASSRGSYGYDPKSLPYLRDVLLDSFGNPFRSHAIEPSWLAWNDSTVRRIAQAVYTDRAFAGLPILADALEDSGCDNADILQHCRSEGPHARGCWVVDLLLSKE